MRAFAKLDDELERFFDRAAEIAKPVPMYMAREKMIAYAVATYGSSVSETRSTVRAGEKS